MRKSTKPIALGLVLALVAALGIGGTIAWLTDETEEVANTFTAAKLFEEPNTQFTLWEHKAVDKDKDGRYELTAEEVTGNSYGVLPGVNIPKDPTVDIVNLEANAYLYIKVTDGLSEGLSYSIDSANWEQLKDASDAEVAGVWVYKGENAANNVIAASADAKKTFLVNVLAQNEGCAIIVPSTYAGTADAGTLTFEAYIAQATGNGANAAEAWANTFGGE